MVPPPLYFYIKRRFLIFPRHSIKTERFISGHTDSFRSKNSGFFTCSQFKAISCIFISSSTVSQTGIGILITVGYKNIHGNITGF